MRKPKLSDFMLEEKKPIGLTKTEKVQKKSKTENETSYKETAKNMEEYEKNTMEDEQEPVKYDMDNPDKEYHDQMEIMNGQEMIKYGRTPSEQFKKRAEEAITGSSRMGNKTYVGEENGNTEPVWGASNADFGKNLVDSIKASKKKRDDAEFKYVQFGDDIEMTDQAEDGKTRKVAVESKETEITNLISESFNKVNNVYNYTNFKVVNENFDLNEIDKETLLESLNTKPKHVKYKKLFNGADNAKKLVPKALQIEGQIFRFTDGIEAYDTIWSENKAVFVRSMVLNESNRMQDLMNYDSSKAKGRLSESQWIKEDKNIRINK